ncbi:MAG: hypothetical protein PCFJNLEI_01209 [Verrucomicrobiae bacterium]|nr:hypothetical protein [Verrucomicrobiae bacterium]
MNRKRIVMILLVSLATAIPKTEAQWVTRDQRWQPRGPWLWAIPRELPALYIEFNGIDFGHAHLAQTLLRTQDEREVEQARNEVLDFIFSKPTVPPDEGQVAPTFTRLVWEVQKSFNLTHTLHRSAYDVLASDRVTDKEAALRRLLTIYLKQPAAITPHPLDHHGKMWGFPESKTFREKFPKFNSQIWAYHWLQEATYDAQLMGNAARQRELMPVLIEHYHGYLRKPPTGWESMPMMMEAAPEFSHRFPELSAIFDNLHMLHDNLDDVLSRPNLYPSLQAKRQRILEILAIYLQRNHEPQEKYADYHRIAMAMKGEHAMSGKRPPAAKDVISGDTPEYKQGTGKQQSGHQNH